MFYGRFNRSLVAAGIGVFGASWGAEIGGEESRMRSIEATNEQINHEN